MDDLQMKWLKTGLGNIVEYVCRAARAATHGDWEQARLEQLYVWRAGVTIELELDAFGEPVEPTGEGTVLANVLGPWPPPRSSIKDVDAVEMYKVCNIEFHPSEDVITRAPPELERIHKALVGRHDK